MSQPSLTDRLRRFVVASAVTTAALLAPTSSVLASVPELAPVEAIAIGSVDVSAGRGVELAFYATGEGGRSVADLRKVDVEIRSDGEKVEISEWAMSPTSGSTVLIAIDRSRTMTGRPLDYARSAAHSLIESLDAHDRVGLLLIGRETEVVVSFEDSRAHLLAQLQMLETDPKATNPKIWDAVKHGIYLLRGESRPGVVVLFSDGRDQGSKATPDSLIAAASAGPDGGTIPIHPVAYRGRGTAGLPALKKLTGAGTTSIQTLDRKTKLLASAIAPQRNAYRVRLDVELDGATHEIEVAAEGAQASSKVRFPLVIEASHVSANAEFPLTGLMLLTVGLLFLVALLRRTRRWLRTRGWSPLSTNRWSRSYGTGS